MKTNVGKTDRMIRVILALVLGGLYASGTLTGTLGYVALALGAIFLLTSAIGFCPLYRIFGISTCKVQK